MLLLLLRHATAEPHGATPDPERALVAKGWKQARRAGAFCRRHALVPDVVLTSPLVRARQTAGEFARTAGAPDPVVVPWLDLGHPPGSLDGLAAYGSLATVCLVGHEPDFSALAALLIGCPPEGLRVRKASLVGIDCPPPVVPGDGQLLFSIPNALMEEG